MEQLFTIAGYLSLLGFILATALLFVVASRFKQSAMYPVFLFFAIGTAIIVAQSAFITLGPDFFGIAEGSLDVWWHFLFWMAFSFHFVGLRWLVALGASETEANPEIRAALARTWGFVGFCATVAVFVLPYWSERVMGLYTSSVLDTIGLHHFIAFALAGWVAVYLFNARANLGQVGTLIANPVLLAVSALSLQHFWELLTESWAVISVSTDVIEGVETIFLIAAALSLIWGAWRLIAFKRAMSTPAATPAQ